MTTPLESVILTGAPLSVTVNRKTGIGVVTYNGVPLTSGGLQVQDARVWNQADPTIPEMVLGPLLDSALRQPAPNQAVLQHVFADLSVTFVVTVTTDIEVQVFVDNGGTARFSTLMLGGWTLTLPPGSTGNLQEWNAQYVSAGGGVAQLGNPSSQNLVLAWFASTPTMGVGFNGVAGANRPAMWISTGGQGTAA